MLIQRSEVPPCHTKTALHFGDSIVEDLKRRYWATLAKRIDALEPAGVALLEGEPGAADIIWQIAHQLKGSGSTYGYPEITAAAEALQNAQEKEIPARLDALLVVLRKVAFEAVD